MNSARFRQLEKRLAQEKRVKETPLVDSVASEMALANGGFRAGKRKRGHSPLKRKARQATLVKTYVMRDELGNVLGTFDTLTTKPE